MNKFLIPVVALVIASFTSHAQTSAGNMMVGGTIDLTSVSYQGNQGNASSFTLTPVFGYFVSDALAVGGVLSVGSSHSGTGAGKSTASSFGFGPFARYYMFTSNENLAIFGQALLTFETEKSDPAFGNVKHGNDIAFAISPGATYFFNEHWAAEVTLKGLSLVSTDPDTDNPDDKYTAVNFNLSSFSPTLGFRYHF